MFFLAELARNLKTILRTTKIILVVKVLSNSYQQIEYYF